MLMKPNATSTRRAFLATFLERLLIMLCVLQLPVSFLIEYLYVVHNQMSGAGYDVEGSGLYLVPLLVNVSLCLFGVWRSTKDPSFRKKFFWRTAIVSLVIFWFCLEIDQSFGNWNWG